MACVCVCTSDAFLFLASSHAYAIYASFMQLLSITLGPYNIAETRVHVHAQLRTITSIAHGELEFVLTGAHVPLPSFRAYKPFVYACRALFQCSCVGG